MSQNLGGAHRKSKFDTLIAGLWISTITTILVFISGSCRLTTRQTHAGKSHLSLEYLSFDQSRLEAAMKPVRHPEVV